MPRSERNNSHRSAPPAYLSRADDRRFGVVAPFDQHIRLQRLDELERGILLELYDGIYRLEGGQHVTALWDRANRTRGAFETAHRFIAVDADDQEIALPSRCEKYID